MIVFIVPNVVHYLLYSGSIPVQLRGQSGEHCLGARVRGPGTVPLDQAAHSLGVVYHRAGAKSIVAERLALLYAHEEGRAERLGQVAVVDVVCGKVAENAGLNVALVMGVVYAVQGLAVIRFLVQRFGIARFLELTIYVMLFFTSGLSSVMLAGLGLLEAWFDWRRLRSASIGDEPE